MGKLDGRVAIVTGSGKGIGKGIALALAEAGAKVIVASRSLEPAEETLAEIKAQGGEGIVVQVDVSKEEQVQKLIQDTISAYGKLDILVNNAGLFGIETEKIDVLDADKWRMMLDVNLTGTFLACKYAIPELLKTSGTVINISSPAGHSMSIRAAYGATKAGIISLTKSIAIQYPGKIRSNCICPGSIDTPGRAASRAGGSPHAKGSVAQLMQRDGKPCDIGAAAVYLASEDARFVNAVVLDVDGALCGQRPRAEDLAPWTDD